jgi:hypothetical protein
MISIKNAKVNCYVNIIDNGTRHRRALINIDFQGLDIEKMTSGQKDKFEKAIAEALNAWQFDYVPDPDAEVKVEGKPNTNNSCPECRNWMVSKSIYQNSHKYRRLWRCTNCDYEIYEAEKKSD